MRYNFYFEVAAIFVFIIILYDYNKKMKIHRRDALLFRRAVVFSMLESMVNVLSSFLIAHTEQVPIGWNIAVTTLFFVLQATMIYALAYFAFTYMNPHFSRKSMGFYIITTAYVTNLALSLTTPFTKFYFYFDEAGLYVQGWGSFVGYNFYTINVILCLIYVLQNQKRLVIKDVIVAGRTAVLIGGGVVVQFFYRTQLVIGFAVALAELYLYLTLENPNDYQDRLTHCGNTYGFKQLIDTKCTQKKTFTVIFIDIKKFRYMNSIYGIDMGDYILQKVAEYLEETFKGQIVFRLHNDLFAVAINDAQDNLTGFALKIQKYFQNPWTLPDGRSCVIDPSVMLCEFPRFFREHTELMKLEKYMLTTLRNTPSMSIMYSENDLAQKYRRREAVEQALKEALQENRLEVYYQPIYDSDAGTYVALEALSRLEDPVLGRIAPDEFIAVAEKSGQIITLGFYVMEKSCQFIEEHLLTNPDNQVSCIHVNLSTLQFAYPGLTARFKMIIENHHIPASMIHLEMTESTMLESPDLVQRMMESLITYGISFALDDYGTGFSNISYLIRFPFRQIKFDKNMVWSFFKNRDAQMIMQNEFDILNRLNKDVIVEGIETKEQFEAMKFNGIHLFQGYYFSRPLSEADCVAFLEK